MNLSNVMDVELKHTHIWFAEWNFPFKASLELLSFGVSSNIFPVKIYVIGSMISQVIGDEILHPTMNLKTSKEKMQSKFLSDRFLIAIFPLSDYKLPKSINRKGSRKKFNFHESRYVGRKLK